MRKNYLDDFKTPQWQKRRLEILSRSDFKCEICGCESRQLHVHHKYYDQDKRAWEYDDKSLIALCDECHRDEHEYISGLYDMVKCLQENSAKAGFTASDLFYYLHGIELSLHFYTKEGAVDYIIRSLIDIHKI